MGNNSVVAKRNALQIAASSIHETRALAESVDEMVTARALTHHWNGLYAYAAIRVGPERALAALHQIGDEQLDDPTTDSGADNAPSSAVVLYRRMRVWLTEHRSTPSPEETNKLSFRPRDEVKTRVLFRLREALAGEQAEVAELHLARSLSLDEVAQVLDLSEATTRAHVEAAQDLARRVCAECSGLGSEYSVRALLTEAYALDAHAMVAPPRPSHVRVLGIGDQVAGRYEIEDLLGSGGFADVYRARDCDVEGHTVALKIARAVSQSDQAIRGAMRELQHLASVFHPSVVQLKDHGWHNGHLWFVMPLYRGETLAGRLERGPLSRAEAREVFSPLAEALATMHRAGVLHQDIKPENIFLANLDPGDGPEVVPGKARVLPVLLDLGVAAKDAEVVLAGTPAYLAPEVAARFAGLPDPPPIGPKADVFSLALTLRDALATGTSAEPLVASTDAFVSKRARDGARTPQEPELRDLRSLFSHWLHVSPDERPTASELREQLQALTAPRDRARRRAATLRWAVPSAVALSCVFGVVVYMLAQEAQVKDMEAAEARVVAVKASQRADSIHADLEMQQARRAELEGSMEKLEQEYRESRLSREELAARLARMDGDLARAADNLEKRREHETELQAALDTSQHRNGDLRSQLDSSRRALARESKQLEATQARAEDLEARMAAASALQDRLRQRLAALEDAARSKNEKADKPVPQSELSPQPAALRTLDEAAVADKLR